MKDKYELIFNKFVDSWEILWNGKVVKSFYPEDEELAKKKFNEIKNNHLTN